MESTYIDFIIPLLGKSFLQGSALQQKHVRSANECVTSYSECACHQPRPDPANGKPHTVLVW